MNICKNILKVFDQYDFFTPDVLPTRDILWEIIHIQLSIKLLITQM